MFKPILPRLVLAISLGASASFADTAPPNSQVMAPTASPPITAPQVLQPPATIPPPPGDVAQAPEPAEPSNGQWTYTEQYGWLWTPYAQEYTYVNGGAGLSYTYAYYPAFGWRWVYSPWVLGFGPTPYWGTRGYYGFAWYSRPWFQAGPAYRSVYRGGAYRGGAYRGGVYRSAAASRASGGRAVHGGGFRGGGGGGGHGHR